jgi:hypothetical protein
MAPNDFRVEIPAATANFYHVAHDGRGSRKIVFVGAKLPLSHDLS